MRNTVMACLAAALVAAPASGLADGKVSSEAPNGSSSVRGLEWLEYGVALERARTEDKHLLVDFYTNWCGWCKKMDRDTYGDSAVASYLRDHFVLAKVNAESPQRFKVGNTTKSGIELAREFGVQSFPITWFIRPDGRPIDRLPGYQPPQTFHKVLEVVHERRYEQPNKHD
jgi:thioredoxin-related protein